MQISIIRYLQIIRAQLTNSLMQRGEKSFGRNDLYAHRVLTQLILHLTLAPGLHKAALDQFDSLLDELTTALSSLYSAGELTQELKRHIRDKPDYEMALPAIQNAARLLSGNPGTESKHLIRKIAAIELAVQDALHVASLEQELRKERPEGQEGPQVEDSPLNQEQKQRLQTCMRQLFTTEIGLEIGAITTVLGGGSKQTLFVHLLNNEKLPECIVLRIDRASSPTGSTVADEYAVLRTVFDAGMPVPQPFAMVDDHAVIGASFMILSKLDGRNIGDGIDVAEPSRSFAISLAQTLAKLHAIAPEKSGTLLPGAAISARERMRQDLEECEGKWRSSGQPSVALELSFAWLRDHLQFADGHRAIIHRDVGCHNLLAMDGQVSALLDWETAAIGNPAQDLAFTYHTVVQMMSWDEFLAEYEKAGGHIPDQTQIDFYRLWRSVWVMGLLILVRSYVLNSETREIFHAYASQYFYQRSERELHQLLNLVLERYE